MSQTSLSARVTVLALAILCMPCLSCLAPESLTCPTGLLCPSDQKCAARQQVCIKTDCGDGVLQAAEACDDGNILDGDGCSRTCESTEACGNGVVDFSVGEACDDGNTGDQDGCSGDCRSNELCANGRLDLQVGERCDDGNSRSGDGCSADCLSLEKCGNGYHDLSLETCDDGNTEDGDGCSANCRSNEHCGNGYTDLSLGERCDDGNTVSGDGCSGDCKSTEYCGNNYIDTARGEQCDDGNTVDGDACRKDCLAGAGCGNGYLDPGEQCDDGNKLDNDDCLSESTCRVATCGDGQVNTDGLRVEQCDDGGESRLCNVNCTTARCGDRIVNAHSGEQCDDGNLSDTDDCIPGVCKLARCGDGYKHHLEACDDGNTLACGTCSANCSRAQPAAAATGTITAVSALLIKDGELFSVNDGSRQLFFEFNTDGSVPDSHVRIDLDDDVPDTDDANEVAQAIVNALARAGSSSDGAPGFRILASRNENRVLLTHAVPGAAGNQPITESVQTMGFRVQGMSGGAGHDCVERDSCRSNEDCAAGLRCLRPVAAPTGTCGR